MCGIQMILYIWDSDVNIYVGLRYYISEINMIMYMWDSDNNA